MTDIERIQAEINDLRERFKLLVELLKSVPSGEGLPVLGEHRDKKYRRISESL
jgi:hypothetical protein